jgi:class 3 adenylate cyclase/tetratricopeptide (TPR) repeat protein
MSQVDELKQAIAALEGQRAVLGDAVVDTALDSLRAKLAELEAVQEPLEQQRKLATVLFADIPRSTEMSQGLEPEEVLEFMDGAMKRLAAPVEAHGGHVIRFMGDGFFAAFGLPVAGEQDAVQAVQAGLSILEEAQAIRGEMEHANQKQSLGVRVGINTGLVAFGGASESEDTIHGLDVVLAKRLESAAPTNGLLISKKTYQQVRGAFEVQAHEAVTAKGFPEPVPVYLVKQAKPRTFRVYTRGVQGVDTRMVGRDSELGQLQAALSQTLRAGQTHVMTVVGEAGVGKSRLLYEFDQWRASHPEPVLAFKARASQEMSGIPFGLMRELLAYRFGILHSDAAAEARQKFETGLGQVLADEPEMKAHFVGALVGYEFSDSPYLRGVKDDAKQLRERALFYLTQYFAALADQTPTVMMLDDIHWGDRPSLEAIKYILDQCPDLPLMVLCLARPALFESWPDWGQAGFVGEAQSVRLDLTPLDRQASCQLVREILAEAAAVPEAFKEKVVTTADGNPFYLEELINVMIDDGVILKDEQTGGWRLDEARLDSLRVPPTLTAVLQARLDRLPLAEKVVLRQASIVGRIFWSEALQALQGNDQPLDAELRALSGRGLIHRHERSTFADTDEYMFKHALMRDVAYEMVLKRTRRAYHGQVAEWLVGATQARGRSGEYPGMIAGHYELAGELDAAADWYLRAGERAGAQGAPAEGRRFFGRALELLQAEDRDRRWRALLGRNEALGTLGESEAQAEDDSALVALARQMEDESKLAEAYHRQASTLSIVGEYHKALHTYEQALATSRRAGNQRIEVLTLGLMAVCLTWLDEREAASARAEEALESARALGDEETLARILTNVSVYYGESGDLGRGTQLLDEQVAINHRLGNRLGEAVGLSNLGYNYVQLGQYPQAISALERSLELAASVGHRMHEAYGRLNLALAHVRNGDPGQAQQILGACFPSLGAVQDRFGQAACQSYSALAKEASGELQKAAECFSKARDTFEEIGVIPYAQDASAGLARCSLAEGHLDMASQHIDRVWPFLTEHGTASMEFPVMAYLTCADVFEALGRLDISAQAIEDGYAELMQRAARVDDVVWRTSFLENVDEHHRITERWHRLGEEH